MQLHQLAESWQGLHKAVGHAAAMQGWFYAISAGRHYLIDQLDQTELCANSAPGERLPEIQHCAAFHPGPNIEPRHFTVGKTPHIVIVGAGPVGLMLAIALKRIFGKHLRLSIIENRVSASGKPVPFGRAWPINIPKDEFALLDNSAPILKVEEHNPYLPWTLKDLESYLLSQVACLADRLIYSREPTDKLLSQLQPDLVFDATGGRLRRKGALSHTCPIVLSPADLQNARGYSAFGVKPTAIAARDAGQLKVSVFDSGICMPTLNDVPLSCWMLKIRAIPQKHGAALLQELQASNKENWAFIWPTHLPDNGWIAFLYLRPVEALQLQKVFMRPVCLSQAVESLEILPDPRWRMLTSFIRTTGMLDDACCTVDPPFLWSPHLHLESLPSCLPGHRFPVLPAGDSLFHGHPHVGNGLGAHLAMVNMFSKTLSGAR